MLSVQKGKRVSLKFSFKKGREGSVGKDFLKNKPNSSVFPQLTVFSKAR